MLISGVMLISGMLISRFYCTPKFSIENMYLFFDKHQDVSKQSH